MLFLEAHDGFKLLLEKTIPSGVASLTGVRTLRIVVRSLRTGVRGPRTGVRSLRTTARGCSLDVSHSDTDRFVFNDGRHHNP